jgi:hypothetical protein
MTDLPPPPGESLPQSDPEASGSASAPTPKKKRFATWQIILLGVVVIAAIGGLAVALSGGDEAESEGQTLDGTIALSGDWDSIEVSSPSGNVTTIGGSRYEQVTGEWCQGGEGYGDITEGSQVVVKDTSGTTVAFGTLEAGSLTGVPPNR